MVVSSKAGNLSVHYVKNPKTGNACINIGWKSDSNWFVVRKLKRGEPCSCEKLAKNSEETALNYAMAQAVRERLTRPNMIEKTRVASFNCEYQNGEFYLTISCAPTVSVIRKVLSEVNVALAPSKLYAAYSANIRMLNGVPNREEFSWCANKLAGELGSLVAVVSGKAAIAADKLNAATTAAASKHVSAAKIAKNTKPTSLSEPQGDTDYPKIKASGVGAIFVSVLLNELRVSHSVSSGNVIVYANVPKLTKKRIDGHATLRYGKMKELQAGLVQLGCASNQLNPSALASVAKSPPTVAKIAELLRQALL